MMVIVVVNLGWVSEKKSMKEEAGVADHDRARYIPGKLQKKRGEEGKGGWAHVK